MFASKMCQHNVGNGVRSSICLVIVAVTLVACTTKTPAPDEMTRTASDTAPADLQLLCAEAAKTAGSGVRALPTSSRRLDAQNYQVDLNVGGALKTCVISAAGTIISVQAS